MKTIYLLLFLILNISCVPKESIKHIYILPENFQGVVVIFYDQKDGENIEYTKDGNIIFKIGANGILKTKMEFTPTDAKNNEFWYPEKKLIPYRQDVGLLNDSISAGGLHYGKLYKELNGTPVLFEMTYISNKQNIDSLANAGESMNLLSLLHL